MSTTECRSNIGQGSWRTIPSNDMIGSIIVPQSKILSGLVQEWESRNQFQWQKIGYNQIKYKWRKLTNYPKQGCDGIYHCAKKQDPIWFGSRMRVQKPVCQTNEWTNTWCHAKIIVQLLPFGLGGGQQCFRHITNHGALSRQRYLYVLSVIMMA